MRAPGPLLASGRDADIFEYGDGLVLRRSREGRSVRQEAQTMEYLRAQRYPVPAVHEVSDDGCDLVMERIDGVSMVDAIARAPWTVRRQDAPRPPCTPGCTRCRHRTSYPRPRSVRAPAWCISICIR